MQMIERVYDYFYTKIDHERLFGFRLMVGQVACRLAEIVTDYGKSGRRTRCRQANRR